jgi:hypothetical protein
LRARRLPLRGADLVLTAMPRLWNGAGISNNTVLVVRCDGGVDPERVRRALDRLLDVCPWPAARLRRPFPWGALHWAAGPRASLVPPAVRRQDLAPGGLRAMVEGELNAAIDPRREPPLRIGVLDDPAADEHYLVVTWFHPLMDPRGSQNLLGHLARADGSPWNGSTPDLTPPSAADPRSLRERGRIAQRSLRYMRTLTPVPPVSPGTSLAAPGRVRFLREVVVEPEPVTDGHRATREMAWRLAVVGRAMARLWAARGLPDVPFLVPISVDLRPKGEPGPTFGNMLAFHFARFRPSDTDDVAALAATLRAQMADALRDGQIEANAVAMEFLRYRPLSTMLNALPGAAGRETFSFNCADLGAFPAALDTLFGRRVLDAYHVPAVLPRPGLGVFFNRCGSGQNLLASWVEGAVTEDEAARILADVRAGMGWAAPS